MSHQQERGIAPIWIVLSIIVIGIVALFIYGIVNRPPNQHIGNNKPWNEHMSQGSADAKNVFIDYTDYFCSFCAQVEAATSNCVIMARKLSPVGFLGSRPYFYGQWN